nr:hypothetical protein [Chroococcidiopsis cubana]
MRSTSSDLSVGASTYLLQCWQSLRQRAHNRTHYPIEKLVAVVDAGKLETIAMLPSGLVIPS